MTLQALRDYVPWQIRDILPRAFVPMALFIVFGGIPILGMLSVSDPGAPQPGSAEFREFLRAAYIGVAPLCMTLGAFLFMTQGPAVDRERQFVRFLFAHPVAPAQFYLQRFIVGLLLFLVCFLPVPLVLRAYGANIPIVGTIVAMTASLVLIGGLTTLCAALVNKDGLLLIVVYVLTQALQRLAATDVLWDWVQPIVRGLPPVESLGLVVKSLLQATDWPVTDLVHVIGYGLGLLVAGLLVIRRAPLAR